MLQKGLRSSVLFALFGCLAVEVAYAADHASVHLRASSHNLNPNVHAHLQTGNAVENPLPVVQSHLVGFSGWKGIAFTVFNIIVVGLATFFLYRRYNEMTAQNMGPHCGLKSCLCCLFCTPAACCFPIDEDTFRTSKPKTKRKTIDGVLADGDTLEWLNSILRALWPKVDKAVQEIVKDQVTPLIQEQMPLPFKGIHFDEFTLGKATPVFGPIKVYETPGTRARKDDVDLRIECKIEYRSDVDISIKAGPAKAGIKSLHFVGDLIVRITQMVDEVPVVGGVVVYFLNPPQVDIDFTGILNVADCPGLSGVIRGAVDKIIANIAVMPNQVCVPLGKEEQGVDLSQMKMPRPLGFLQVRALSASGLTGSDWRAFGKATSDPYVEVKVGSNMWSCSPVYKTCDPKWPQGDKGEVGYLMVYDREQEVQIEVYDYDMVGSNDLIGVAETREVEKRLPEQTNIPLYPTKEQANTSSSNDAAKANECGRLDLQMSFMELVPGKICGDRYILWVKVDSVHLLPGCGKKAQVRASISDGTKGQTPVVEAVLPKAVKVALSKEQEGIIKRLQEKGKSVSYISEVMGIKEDQIKQELEGQKDAMAGDADSLGHEVQVESSLFLAVSPELLREGGWIEISVCGGDGKAIGLPERVPLANVAAATHDKGDGVRWLPGPMHLEMSSRAPTAFRAEVALAFIGTRHSG